MSLNLQCMNLLQVNPISFNGTLKLISRQNNTPLSRDKLVIGDDSGLVSCYEFKRGEPNIIFQSNTYNDAITSITIPDNNNYYSNKNQIKSKADDYKIYLSHGHTVSGLNKKGKEFFTMKSSLTENIHQIHAQGKDIKDTQIWIACECIFSQSKESNQINFFQCPDFINDACVGHIIDQKHGDAVLGCQDNCIRIIRGDTLMLAIPTIAAVTSVCLMPVNNDSNNNDNNTNTTNTDSKLDEKTEEDKKVDDNSTNKTRDRDEDRGIIVYGMSNGSVGLVCISLKPKNTFSAKLKAEEGTTAITTGVGLKRSQDPVADIKQDEHNNATEIKGDGDKNHTIEATSIDDTIKAESKEVGDDDKEVASRIVINYRWRIDDPNRSAVTCLAVSNISLTGNMELIVGRTDGHLQIYGAYGETASELWRSGAVPSSPTELKEATGKLTSEFFTDVGECIKDCVCGYVNSDKYPEVIIVTYSGRVISYTSEPIHEVSDSGTNGKSIATVNNENRLKNLQNEVRALEDKVKKLRKIAGGGGGMFGGRKKSIASSDSMQRLNSDGSISLPDIPVKQFNVATSFKLDPDLGQYCLSVETQNHIDMILIQSNVQLDYLEDVNSFGPLHKKTTIRSRNATTGVVTVMTGKDLESFYTANQESARENLGKLVDSIGGGRTMFSLICLFQNCERKSDLYLRLLEGLPGTLTVTVVVKCENNTKSAKVVSFPIRSLCLHSRIHKVDKGIDGASQWDADEKYDNSRKVIKHIGTAKTDNESVEVATLDRQSMKYNSLGLNKVTFHSKEDDVGTKLSTTFILEWLHALLPDVPQNISETSDGCSEVLYFENVLTGAQLRCRIKSSSLTIESENPSVIAITKEYITKLATQRRMHLRDEVQTEETTVKRILAVLWPRLCHALSVTKMTDICPALQEITADIPMEDRQWLKPEYGDILHNVENIDRELKMRNKSLEFLVGTITDMFADWWKLKGQDVSHALQEFNDVVCNCNHMEVLLERFFAPPSSPVRVSGDTTRFDYSGVGLGVSSNVGVAGDDYTVGDAAVDYQYNEIAMYNETSTVNDYSSSDVNDNNNNNKRLSLKVDDGWRNAGSKQDM